MRYPFLLVLGAAAAGACTGAPEGPPEPKSSALVVAATVTINQNGFKSPICMYEEADLFDCVGAYPTPASKSWQLAAGDHIIANYAGQEQGVEGGSYELGVINITSGGTVSFKGTASRYFTKSSSGRSTTLTAIVKDVKLDCNGLSTCYALGIPYIDYPFQSGGIQTATFKLIPQRSYSLQDYFSYDLANPDEQDFGPPAVNPLLVDSSGNVSITDDAVKAAFSGTGTTVKALPISVTVDLNSYLPQFNGGDTDIYLHGGATSISMANAVLKLQKGRMYNLGAGASLDPTSNEWLFGPTAAESHGEFKLSTAGVLTINTPTQKHFQTTGNTSFKAKVGYIRVSRAGATGPLCLDGVVCSFDGDLTAALILDRNYTVNGSPVRVNGAFTCGFSSVVVEGMTLPVQCGQNLPGSLAPNAPTALTAKLNGASRIDLAWTDNSNNESGFEIERSVNGAPFGLYQTTAANVGAYSDIQLPKDNTYAYRVRARTAGGLFSTYSNEDSVTIAAPPAPMLDGAQSGPNRVTLTWKDVTTAENGYRVIRVVNGVTSTLADLAANVLTYTDEQAVTGVPNTYRVAAYNSVDNSPPSNDVVITPKSVTDTNVIVSNHLLNKIDYDVEKLETNVFHLYNLPDEMPHPEVAKICLSSTVDNLRWSFAQESTDWTLFDPSRAPPCASCGPVSSPEQLDVVAPLELKRYHRPRFEYLPSSFGPGVFSNFDKQLFLYKNGIANQPNLVYYDPELASPPVTFFETSTDLGDAAVDGIFRDDESRAYKRILVQDQAGAPTPDLAKARTVLLERHDGSSLLFELFQVNGNNDERRGRLSEVRNRANQVAAAVTYVFATTATDSDLGNDRMRLYSIKEVKSGASAYNTAATFTYAKRPSTQRWVATTVAMKSGPALTAAGNITYAYGDTGDSVDTLVKITFPNGDTSQFGKTWSPASQTWVHSYVDVAQGPSRTNKTVHVSPAVYQSSDGAILSQPPNLVRKIVGADNADIFQNWEQPGNPRITYLKMGAGRLARLTSDEAGNLTDVADATTKTSDPLTATFAAKESYVSNGQAMLVQRKSPQQNTTSVTRDPASRRVTSSTAADGGQATYTYNAAGLPTRVVDTLGRITDYTYDSAGRVLSIVRGSGTSVQATWTYQYGSAGQITRGVDPLGRATDYQYDTNRRLTAVLEPPDTSGGTRPTRKFEYDSLGRLSASVDAGGRRTTYAYDPRHRLLSTTYADSTQETFKYGTGSLAGFAVETTDRKGIVQRSTFDAARRRIRIDSAAGRPEQTSRTTVFVPGTNNIQEETDAGERTVYVRDARNNVIERQVYVGATKTLVYRTGYDADDRKVSETDPYGRRTFYVLDAKGRTTRTVTEMVPEAVTGTTPAQLQALARQTGGNPAYTIVDISYNVGGDPLQGIDARGQKTLYAYDARGRRIEDRVVDGTTAAVLQTTKYQYDLIGNLIKQTHPRSFTEGTTFETVHTYNGRDLVASTTEGSGTSAATTTQFTYTATGKVATETDGRGGVTTRAYDNADRVATATDPSGAIVRYTYDGNGNMTQLTDPLNHLAKMTYDGLNRRTSESNGANETISYQYDDNLADGVGLDAQFASVIGGLGLGVNGDGYARLTTNPATETQLDVYDGQRRLLARVDGNGNVTRQTYDTVTPEGLVETATIDALGKSTKVRTDGANQQRVQIDAAGKQRVRSYDASGNLVSERDPAGVGNDCTYDNLNHRTACTDTQGAQVKYAVDVAGNLVGTTDAMGKAEQCAYDALNRRTSCKDRLGNTTSWAYDKNSNLTSMTDEEGRVTAYTYDARNLRTSTKYPDSSSSTDVVTATFDAARRLTTIKNQTAQTTTMAYDNANRLVTRTYASGLTDTFTYDVASRLKTAVSNRYSTQVSRAHDRGGRLTAETQTVAGRSFTLGFGYDAAGNQTRLTYPDGTQLARTFTDRGELASVSHGSMAVANFTYDDAGRLTTTSLGNGLIESRSYQADGALTQINIPGLGDLGYVYDANKRKLSETGSLASGGAQGFSYDGEDRLVGWTRGSGTQQSWTLSAVGDWKSVTRNGTVESRTHNSAHELTAINGTSLTYDSQGNLTKDNKSNTLSWESDNRLKQYTKSGGTATKYLYDALGRKAGKVVGTTTTTFVNAGQETVAEYSNSTLQVQYVPGARIDDLLALVKGGSLYFLTKNHLGTVVAATDQGGAVRETYRYDATGSRTVLAADGSTLSSSAIGNEVGFTGRYHDKDSGLIDFRSRQYHPGLGRFISRDDEYHDGSSLYAAYFIPNAIDPTGHWSLRSLWNAIVPDVKAGLKIDAYFAGDFAFGILTAQVDIWAGVGFSKGGVFVGLKYDAKFGRVLSRSLPKLAGEKSACSGSCCGFGFDGRVGDYNLLKYFEGMDTVVSCKMEMKDDKCLFKMTGRCEVDLVKWTPGLSQASTFVTIWNKVLGEDSLSLKAGGFIEVSLSWCQKNDTPRLNLGPLTSPDALNAAQLKGGVFLKVGKL
jgi:RHS repeat-associated protein